MKYTIQSTKTMKVALKQQLTIGDLILDKGTIVTIEKVGSKLKVVSPTDDTIMVKSLKYEPI